MSEMTLIVARLSWQKGIHENGKENATKRQLSRHKAAAQWRDDLCNFLDAAVLGNGSLSSAEHLPRGTGVAPLLLIGAVAQAPS